MRSWHPVIRPQRYLPNCSIKMDSPTASTLDDTSTPDTEDSHSSRQKPVPPWIVLAAQEEFSTQPAHRVNTSSYGSVLIRFRSPAAHRLQLRSASCAIWFPENICSGFAESFSFMASQAPTTPSLAIALDASCLVQVGQERADDRMVLEGKKMHCDALRFLWMELSRPACKRSDALLGTIMVLQVMESNICMDGTDWRNHSKGAMALMSQASKDSKGAHFGWPRLVEHQFIAYQFWEALISRRGLEGMLLDDAPAILQLAQQVPGLLKLCDRLCCDDGTEDEALDLVFRLKELHAELASWTAQWNRCMREARFQLVSAETLPFPKQRKGTERQSRAFPQAFRFNELNDALDHAICSASMLEVKRAMLDLATAAQKQAMPLVDTHLASRKSLSAAVTACADSLCMGLPYLCEPIHGKFGKVVTAPALGIAMGWYTQLYASTGSKQLATKLVWCRDAAAAVEEDGIRMLLARDDYG